MTLPSDLGVSPLPAGSSWHPTYRLKLNGTVIDPSDARYTTRLHVQREGGSLVTKTTATPGDSAYVVEGNDTLVRFLWSRADVEAIRAAAGAGLYRVVLQVLDSTAPATHDAYATGWLELEELDGVGVLPT